MKCDRCGEANPAEIHTCTPKQSELETVTQFKFQNYGWWRDETGKLQLGTWPTHPVTEPVAWINPNEQSEGYAFSFKQQGVFTVPLYMAQASREWIDLTATEIKILRRAANNDREFAELVQAKLKEKNRD